MPETAPSTSPASPDAEAPAKKRHHWRRIFAVLALLVVVGLVIGRICLPIAVRWYVNRVIDESPLYDGHIGGVDIHLYRGAYTIKDIRLVKTTGNVPVPLFAAKRLDLALEWKALLARRIVARVVVEEPELNFVDAPDESSDQTGAGGPWLQIVQDLSPFAINSAVIHNGSIHFRAYQTTPPVDVYLSDVEATVSNLRNIQDETTPLNALVDLQGTAMESGDLDLKVKFNPFSYNPTFELAFKLLGLNVTKVNDLAKAYGDFDFEHGSFDLIIEMTSTEGQLDGYVKPLFRNLKILSVSRDSKDTNPFQFFWEALVGGTTDILTNQRRDQFGTVIPFTGSTSAPQADILSTVGNVLRNAFVRAYLPRLAGRIPDINDLQFSRGKSDEALHPAEK